MKDGKFAYGFSRLFQNCNAFGNKDNSDTVIFCTFQVLHASKVYDLIQIFLSNLCKTSNIGSPSSVKKCSKLYLQMPVKLVKDLEKKNHVSTGII